MPPSSSVQMTSLNSRRQSRSSVTPRPWPTSARPTRPTPAVTSSAAARPCAASGDERCERIRTRRNPAIAAGADRAASRSGGAVIDFLTTASVTQPQRFGKPLRGELAGVWAARRGTYRVLYRLREDTHEVIVLRIDHRRDVYRPN